MTSLIKKAIKFATQKHKGQLYNNKPFILHPMRVARKLTWTRDDNLITAGWLHDLLEDTPTTFEEIAKEFNLDVALLVKEVTKTGYNAFPNLTTLRGYMLKFADRGDNLENARFWPEEKQKKYMEKSKFWKTE